MRTSGWRIFGEVHMSKATEMYGVLFDTGFLIRLNKPDDPLHANARAYLRYLIEGEHALYVSTIALAEYAVKDEIKNLPMRYFRVLPFNIDHAQKAGECARIVFSKREQIPADITQRVIIPNDTKMFAQADVHPAISHYLTADQRCATVFNLIQDSIALRFKIIQLTTPYHQVFGELNLGA